MRRVFIILGGLLVILLLAAIFTYVKMEWLLSRILSSRFGTEVVIKDIAFSKLKVIDIQNVSVANPKNFIGRHALEIGSTNISAPYLNYFKQIIRIESIEITDLTLTVDFIGKTTNWELLMDQLDTNDPSESSTSYAVIDILTFNNLRIRISKNNGKLATYVIPKIVLRKVKTKNGELAKRLTEVILSQLIYNIRNVISIPLNITQDALKPFDSLLNPFSSPSQGP